MSDTLTEVQRTFILHWGEMGNRWGINRTMAQIHALLLISEQPLAADDIVNTLGVARSHVSTSLRELQGWGIVRVVHRLGDRRDHFASETDPWILFRTVARERKRREFDPTTAMLREAVANDQDPADAYARARMADLLEFFELCGGWFDAAERLPQSAILALLKAGPALGRLVGSFTPKTKPPKP